MATGESIQRRERTSGFGIETCGPGANRRFLRRFQHCLKKVVGNRKLATIKESLVNSTILPTRLRWVEERERAVVAAETDQLDAERVGEGRRIWRFLSNALAKWALMQRWVATSC